MMGSRVSVQHALIFSSQQSLIGIRVFHLEKL